MERLEVSGAVRPLQGSLGVKGIMKHTFSETSLPFTSIQCRGLQIRGVKPPLLCISHEMVLNKAEG